MPSKEWVAVERISGTVENGPVTVEVRIDREMAPAGRQWMALVVKDGAERREVPLIAFINRSIPIVRPERLPFGEDLERMILSLKNTGNLPLVWSIGGESSWIAAVPEEGILEQGASREIEISADRDGLTPGNYSDQLTISYDGDGKSIQVPADLTVRFNRAPEADAGLDQTVVAGGWMRLDGSASLDADGDSLSYSWIAPEEIDLDDVHAVQPRFRATVSGNHRIGLVVDDGRVESAPAEVAVQVIETAPGEEISVALQSGEFHLSGVSIDMVWIEPGSFIMGSPVREEGRGYDEEPQHEVTISQGFFLGKYEITQEQWEAVMGSRPWEGKEGARKDPRHPVVFVSWRDLQKFIDRLNEWEGMDLFRLPTEAEWEYACRAGTTTRWSFGDDENYLKDYAWYRANTWDLGEQSVGAIRYARECLGVGAGLVQRVFGRCPGGSRRPQRRLLSRPARRQLSGVCLGGARSGPSSLFARGAGQRRRGCAPVAGASDRDPALPLKANPAYSIRSEVSRLLAHQAGAHCAVWKELRSSEPVRRTMGRRRLHEDPAPHHAQGAGERSDRVYLRLFRIRTQPVMDPFPGVAVHVVQSPRIRQL